MSDNRPSILNLMKERLIFFDGATGSNLQTRNLTEDDFDGLDGCNEILVQTRPDVIRELHASWYEIGSHVSETDSFGSTSIVLNEYGIADRAYELNVAAAKLAKEVAVDFSTPDRPRYVAGSMGPTTKLPTLGHIGFDTLRDAYREQARGLMDGGADMLVIETCQDILQIKAAMNAVSMEFSRAGRRLPVAVSVTIESVGTMLLGTDIGAALAAIGSIRPDIIGINCATGPAEMKQHVQFLSKNSGYPILVQPNAGLPENIGGETVYPLTPQELADWHLGFAKEDGINIIGGCCGTSPDHIRRVIETLDNLSPVSRKPLLEAAASSIYFANPLHQEPRPFLIGETTNANGSKAFRELLLADDFDSMVTMAKEQESGGAHALDVCVAYVGRDEMRDMKETLTRFVQQVKLPLVIDSTQLDVMESALKLAGGRCIINSVNFEDGEEKARKVFALARDYGAAVIALTIDEKGMAKTTEEKVSVAKRLVGMATEEFGLSSSDIIIDTLTFTVGSGDETLRDAAIQTVEAIRRIKKEIPGAFTVLGVSNISFGLKMNSRVILNSVFLQMAVEAGLDMAIIDAKKMRPLHTIDPADKAAADNLLLNRSTDDDPDPLMAYIKRFEGVRKESSAESQAADDRPLEERIRQKVIDGDKSDLELLLSAAVTHHTPLAIINEMLIPGMKVVGDLFGSGKLQLPFVLQSAEVMKQAVSFLEPLMDKSETETRGKLVLATVKGDVHDIGKNLVDILLSNNGYQVFNLGIKVPIEEMIRVWQEEKADAIGMSGLLVKSTVVMKENLEELKRRGLDPPVMLGGAALTRRYVEEDLAAFYGPKVSYGQDAFDGLRLMGRILSGESDSGGASKKDSTPGNIQATIENKAEEAAAFIAVPEGIEPADVPEAPFLGTRLVELDTEEVFSYLNETALFRGRWQYRRGSMSKETFDQLITDEVRPAFEALKRETLEENLFHLRGIYGYLPCFGDGNELIILDEEAMTERARFRFPRQLKAPHHCISDYFRSKTEGPDLFGFLVVTAGEAASQRTKELFESNQYLKYLQLHGLSVEAAEAAAECLHARMRKEMSIEGDDPDQREGLFRMQYRGARYSFGYPACPNLDDQFPLFDLLDAGRVGVTLSENAQMNPEQSVSAFVVHHPAARYYNPLA